MPYNKLDDIAALAKILKNEKEPIPSHVPSKLRDLIEEMRDANYVKRPRALDVLKRIELFANQKEFQDLSIAVETDSNTQKDSQKNPSFKQRFLKLVGAR